MEDDDRQHGKYGKKGHFKLLKMALIQCVEKYYDTFATIRVENQTVTLGANISSRWDLGTYFGEDLKGQYVLHPDITMIMRTKEQESGHSVSDSKIIIIECETSLNGLLKHELRMTAYKMLRLRYPDRQKFMMYMAFPEELKGKVDKPDSFNDLWFFEV